MSKLKQLLRCPCGQPAVAVSCNCPVCERCRKWEEQNNTWQYRRGHSGKREVGIPEYHFTARSRSTTVFPL